MFAVRFVFFLMVLAGLMPRADAAEATATLDKIGRAGAIVLGIRESSYPLSYLDAAHQPIGYHIDICRRIAAAVKTRLGRSDLAIRTEAVTSQSRIPRLLDGTIDLECGSTTNNAARQRLVAFAPTTYVTAVRVAVKKSRGITGLSQLNGGTVVTTSGSTSVELLKARQQGTGFHVTQVFGADHAESFRLLESDAAAAFVMDDNLLAGLIANSARPDEFEILGETLTVEPIAIMLRRDDPAFKALVDDTVKAMMASGELARLYDRWFLQPIPPKGIRLNFPMSPVLAGLIQFPGDEPVEAFRAQE